MLKVSPLDLVVHSAMSKWSKVFLDLGPESRLPKKEINSMLKKTVACIARGEWNTKQDRSHSTNRNSNMNKLSWAIN